jgi:hypothetical protein
VDEVQMLGALGAQAIQRMLLMDVGAHSFLGSTCGVAARGARRTSSATVLKARVQMYLAGKAPAHPS